MNGPRTIRGLLLAVALLLAANLIAMMVSAQNRLGTSLGPPTQHGGVVIVDALAPQSLFVTTNADGDTVYFWRVEAGPGSELYPKTAEAKVFHAR